MNRGIGSCLTVSKGLTIITLVVVNHDLDTFDFKALLWFVETSRNNSN